MSDQFAFDVFLSHSRKDKDVVRPLAERLRADGVRVWFDEWEINPGDSVPDRTEDGLKHSRALALFLSQNWSESDWATLEAQTLRFRDPLNKDRRILPFELGPPFSAPLEEDEYAGLVEACQALTNSRVPEDEAAFDEKGGFLLHTNYIRSLAFSHDSKYALSSTVYEHQIRLWELEGARVLRVLKGHTGNVWSLAFSPDSKYALSGGNDRTLRLWDLDSGRVVQVWKNSCENPMPTRVGTRFL